MKYIDIKVDYDKVNLQFMLNMSVWEGMTQCRFVTTKFVIKVIDRFDKVRLGICERSHRLNMLRSDSVSDLLSGDSVRPAVF